MKKETYQAQGICLNCGRKNYPQWGEYEVGKKLEEYPCPNCGCMTWTLDNLMDVPASVTPQPRQLSEEEK